MKFLEKLLRWFSKFYKPTWADILNMANECKWEINPPELESPFWVIYNEKHNLGGGIATGRTIHEALYHAWLSETSFITQESHNR